MKADVKCCADTSREPLSNDKIAILIKKASLECDKIAYPVLTPHGLTLVQYKIIKLLYRKPPATVRQIDIERYYSLTNPTVTGILQNLQRNGWIERLPNPQDARSKVIRLTRKAEERKEALYHAGEEVERQLTKTLNHKEKAQLITLLNRMLGSAQ